MALFNKIKNQFRSVIEWTGVSPNDLFAKWSDDGDEIKNASKLIVGPGQGCIFVYQGKIEALILEEGMTNLETENIPFWTTISKFMQAFRSEHKVGIYFFKKTTILDQKWGTSSVVKYEDPKYKFPVGLRAFGNYSFRLADPASFFVNVVGSNSGYTVGDFRTVMTARLVQPLTDFLAESRFTYTDIDANREEIAAGILAKLVPEFAVLGFEIKDFKVEGTSFDEDTMKRINRIADMTAEAQAANAVGLNYSQVQQLDAMKAAASNEGGAAGMGMGLGAGMQFGNMMAGAMGQGSQGGGRPEASPAKEDPVEKLGKLKKMLDADLISQEDFDLKKKEILASM